MARTHLRPGVRREGDFIVLGVTRSQDRVRVRGATAQSGTGVGADRGDRRGRLDRRAVPGRVRRLAVAAAVWALSLGAGASAARAATWYAYAGATGAGAVPACPATPSIAAQCSLAQALASASAGDTVDLATSGAGAGAESYVGNWTVATPGTSPGSPLTIEPAPGVIDPTLDGDNGNDAGCTTASCAHAVLTDDGTDLVLQGLTIQNADHTAGSGDGGGLLNAAGGSVVISGATFSDDRAADGGAIDSADNVASGPVSVTDSTFTGNSSGGDGGAIDNGDSASDPHDGAGQGSLSVSESTFIANAAGVDGGAIDDGDLSGHPSTLSVTGSTFSGNSAHVDGGAVDNGDSGMARPATVADSTFSANRAVDGGAIDNADFGGTASMVVTASTFAGDDASNGAAISSGIFPGPGSRRMAVAGDIFAEPCDQGTGGSWSDGGYNVTVGSQCVTGAGSATDRSQGSVAALGLGLLAANGGPTETIALQAGSPAIGAIPIPTSPTLLGATVALCPGADQRGYPRPGLTKTSCDAGAFETQGVPATAPLIVNELRLNGPPSGKPDDAYVDLYNASGAPLSLDGWSVGWITAAAGTGSTPLAGVTLAPGGHYLLADESAFSLPSPGVDQDLGLPGGSDGLTGVSVQAAGRTMDGVGYAGSPDAAGTGLTRPSYPSGVQSEIAFVRRFAAGVPVDTGDNASDFVLVAPDAATTSYGERTVLGSPSPLDRASPVQVNGVAQSSLLDPLVPSGAAPNTTYLPPGNGQPLSPANPGTLVVGRTITNVSNLGPDPFTITALQIRLTGLSTYGEQSDPVYGAGALLSDFSWSADSSEHTAATTLTSISGGLNSVLSVALPGGQLQPGSSVGVEIAFHVYAGGGFAFAYNLEDDLAPFAPPAAASSEVTTPAPPAVTPALTGAVTGTGATVTTTQRVTTTKKKATKKKAKKKKKAVMRKKKKAKPGTKAATPGRKRRRTHRAIRSKRTSR
jgi:hypothetical protein